MKKVLPNALLVLTVVLYTVGSLAIAGPIYLMVTSIMRSNADNKSTVMMFILLGLAAISIVVLAIYLRNQKIWHITVMAIAVVAIIFYIGQGGYYAGVASQLSGFEGLNPAFYSIDMYICACFSFVLVIASGLGLWRIRLLRAYSDYPGPHRS